MEGQAVLNSAQRCISLDACFSAYYYAGSGGCGYYEGGGLFVECQLAEIVDCLLVLGCVSLIKRYLTQFLEVTAFIY